MDSDGSGRRPGRRVVRLGRHALAMRERNPPRRSGEDGRTVERGDGGDDEAHTGQRAPARAEIGSLVRRAMSGKVRVLAVVAGLRGVTGLRGPEHAARRCEDRKRETDERKWVDEAAHQSSLVGNRGAL